MINPLEKYKWIATAITVVAIFGVGSATGFGLRGVIANAAEAQLKQQHAEAMQLVSDTAAKAAADALVRQKALQNQIAAIDAAHTEELNREKAENDRLRDDIRAGTRRLSIRANCPASGGGAPNGAGASGMDNGTAVELAPAAGRAYSNLRAGIIADRAKLSACQAFVKSVTN